MKRKITLLIAGAVAGGTFIAVFGLTTSASASRTSKGALVALGKTGLGRVLVDARGRTLYLFDGDTHRKSSCDGACAVYWPPLLSSAKPRPGSGVRPSFLGLTKRTDGKRQVTYAGHPLYRYVGERSSDRVDRCRFHRNRRRVRLRSLSPNPGRGACRTPLPGSQQPTLRNRVPGRRSPRAALAPE
jgi:predicted lipoprotein with Yx(FWY)xxD motif